MLRQRRYHETRIAALFQMFGFGNDASSAAPTFARPIINVLEDACRSSGLFPLLLRLFQFCVDHADDSVILGEADHVIDAVALAPGQDLLPTKIRIRPHQNMYLRPRLPNLFDNPLQFLQGSIGGIAVRGPQSCA